MQYQLKTISTLLKSCTGNRLKWLGVLGSLSVFFLSSCSQEKNTLLSRSWHNLTARDNSYFLARERTREIEKELERNFKNDYNKILFPIVLVDTTATKGAYKDKSEDIIYKSKIPINRHKNSMYVDDSYILIGKMRVLRAEWKLAEHTFKFVNSEGKDINQRHEALIQFYRLQLLKRDFRTSYVAANYLQKQKLNDKNTRDLALTEAQYHRLQDNYKAMIPEMEKAVPFIKRGERKARAHFILGQLHQWNGNDSAAYTHYKQATKNNPPYELLFYSKLYMTQVKALENSSDKKKTLKFYYKLLKDLKNQEYKDKIYYEIAQFYFKQDEYDSSLVNLRHSLNVSKGNNYQKAASHLKTAEIYYNQKKNYPSAKMYYDSCVALWDKNDKDYKALVERQKILTEFVKHWQTKVTEDSLQAMARMPKDKLEKYIDEAVAREEAELERQEKAKEAARNATQQQANNSIIDNTPIASTNNSNWYFYNATAVSRGQEDFKRKWGNRKLEDNWRRSEKEVSINNATNPNAIEDPKNTNTNTSVSEAPKSKVDRSKFYKDIPDSPEKMAASDKRLQEALFELGRIYNLKLNETEEAIKSYESLIQRYPGCEKEAETFYALYTIFLKKNSPRAEEYKNLLFTKYPNSLYSKLIRNPNYLKENKIANQQAAQLYKEAYTLYQAGSYGLADSALVQINRTYPDNDITDKIALLHSLILGQTKNPVVYKESLQKFIVDFPTSPLVGKANELIATSDQYLKKQEEKGVAFKASDVKYSTNTSKPHYFMVVLQSKNLNPTQVRKQFTDFNASQFAGKGLKEEVVVLNDSSIVLLVKGFEAMYPAKQYMDKQKQNGSPMSKLSGAKPSPFIISDDNYELFYTDRKIPVYQEFYSKNY